MEGIYKIEEINDEEWVTFGYQFDNELSPEIISFLSKHKKVRFPWNSYFNKSVDNLPDCLTHLTFGINFNQPVTYQTESSQNGKSPTLLPNSLTNLEFVYGSQFNQPVNNLPRSLTYLAFGCEFNQPVNNLPRSLTHLMFAEYSKFNQPVDNLPESLTHLKFGDFFNQQFDISDEDSPTGKSSILPNSLRYLEFGEYFNQPVDNLPNSLTHLTFGINFNQPVDNIPESLTHLIFTECSIFNQPIDNLPESLTLLTFGIYSNFDQPVDNLPQSLTHLKFGGKFNQPVDNLSNSLTHLKFGKNFNQPINKLPNSLTHLKFDKYSIFNQPVDISDEDSPTGKSSILPNSLTHLELGKEFNQRINKLPTSLKYVIVNDSYPYRLGDKIEVRRRYD